MSRLYAETHFRARFFDSHSTASEIINWLLFHAAPDGTLFAGWIQTSPFGRPALKDFKQAITFRQEKNYPPRGTFQGTVPG
jgi:hypothetical protein